MASTSRVIRMSEDDESGGDQTHVYIQSMAGEVTVRDDGGGLEHMTELAEKLHQEALEASERIQDADGDDRGWQ